MIERYCALKEYLDVVALDNSEVSNMQKLINPHSVELLKRLLKLLMPFKKATMRVCLGV
jgi:hypothetical protein